MKKSSILFIITLITFSLILSSCTDIEELGGCDDPFDPEAWELVWEDEFDGDILDESKWNYQIGDGCDLGICGWGNNELQYYTDRPENVYLSNGRLVLKAIKENPLYLDQYQYSSARLTTKNKGDWKYGRIDVKARIPSGQGLWPAVWMLPTDNVYGGWPKSGEIDIMESRGDTPNKIEGTIHFGHDYHRYINQPYFLESGTFSDGFHEFSTIWTEDCIRFLMDGIEYATPLTRSSTLPTTWPFDQDFHMLLNVAVGGNYPGDPSPITPFPQVLLVEYVKVYQQK